MKLLNIYSDSVLSLIIIKLLLLKYIRHLSVMWSLLFIFVIFLCTDDVLPRPPARGPKIPATTPAMKSAMTPATTPATTPFNFRYYDPVFGALTPSQEIRDFVASVFGPREGGDVYDATTPADSGENLKPKNNTNAAHVGFEQYWPGGEWVFKKAEMDRCNSTDTACRTVFGKYGKVCAGNHDLTAHTTFDTICDMYDTNCWDGTYSTFTTAGDSNVVWLPIGPSGSLDIQLATAKTSTPTGFILARTRSIHVEPRWTFEYGTKCKPINYFDLGDYSEYTYSCISVNELKPDGLAGRGYAWKLEYLFNFDKHPSLEKDKDLRDKKTRQFRLQWNETSGSISIVYLWDGAIGEDNPEKTSWAEESWAFAAHYFGIWGGTPTEPTWWEISGLPRGYMLAYRGRCRADLPTIPPEQPVRLGHNIEVEMYNFAERLDEFGYNYSRVPKKTSKEFFEGDDELDG